MMGALNVSSPLPQNDVSNLPFHWHARVFCLFKDYVMLSILKTRPCNLFVKLYFCLSIQFSLQKKKEKANLIHRTQGHSQVHKIYCVQLALCRKKTTGTKNNQFILTCLLFIILHFTPTLPDELHSRRK